MTDHKFTSGTKVCENCGLPKHLWHSTGKPGCGEKPAEDAAAKWNANLKRLTRQAWPFTKEWKDL